MAPYARGRSWGGGAGTQTTAPRRPNATQTQAPPRPQIFWRRGKGADASLRFDSSAALLRSPNYLGARGCLCLRCVSAPRRGIFYSTSSPSPTGAAVRAACRCAKHGFSGKPHVAGHAESGASCLCYESRSTGPFPPPYRRGKHPGPAFLTAASTALGDKCHDGVVV